MKTVIKLIIVILPGLLIIPFSYADNIDSGEKSVTRVMLDYHDGAGDHIASAKTPDFLMYQDDEGMKHERFSLFKSGKEMDITNRTNAVNDPYSVHADIYTVPESLVNNISYDFSSTGFKRSSRHSLDGMSSSMSDVLQMGAAFLTNLAVHEFGHQVVADYVGAEGSKLNFFQKSGGDFFLGTSSVDNIDGRSRLPYTMGGEFFADLTFEHSLRDYRNNPNSYNKSLLFYSGTDFLWYCFYAFYIAGDNPSYDPITISKETGISRDMLFSVALAKTMINAYRIYSGNDFVVPYFNVDKYSASLNFMIPFDFGS